MKRILIGSMLLLFMVIAMAFTPSNSAVFSSKVGADLQIVDFEIEYEYFPMGGYFRKVINCGLYNSGDSSFDTVDVVGDIYHIFVRNRESGFSNFTHYFSNNPWNPGELRYITVVKFYYRFFRFWVDNGIFEFDLEITHPGDSNPDNNRISGYFLIYDEGIRVFY